MRNEFFAASEVRSLVLQIGILREIDKIVTIHFAES
jgi:hypothetical protein